MNSTISQLPAQSVWIGVGLLAAAALTVGLASVQERTHRTPPSDLMAVFGGCVVVGAMASRLFWVVLEPSVELGLLWQHPWSVVDPRQGGHSSFGALAGAMVVVGLWQRASLQQNRARQALAGLDALGAGGLAGLALARLGCLANGCDFGKPADVAWAIAHEPHTDAFRTHLERGWVGADAAWSAAVHPFALYLAVGTLAIVAWMVWAVSTRRLGAGRVALAACGAYLLLRFAAEWTRDEATVLDLYVGFNIHHLFAVLGLGVVFAGWRWLDACDRKAAASSSSARASF